MQNKADFPGVQNKHDRQHNGRRPHDALIGNKHFRTVGHAHHYPVTGPDAQIDQAIGQTVGILLQFPVSHFPLTGVQQGIFTELFQVFLRQVGQDHCCYFLMVNRAFSVKANSLIEAWV